MVLLAVEVFGWSAGDFIGLATMIASCGITLVMGYNHAQVILYKWERERRRQDLEDEIAALKAREAARREVEAADDDGPGPTGPA